MNAPEIRWSRRRKPVDEEREEERIPQLMLKRSRCSCASCYRCLLSFSSAAVQMLLPAPNTQLCLLSSHVGVSSEWIYWSLNPALLVFLNSLMPHLFILFVLLFIFTVKPLQSLDRRQQKAVNSVILGLNKHKNNLQSRVFLEVLSALNAAE